MPAKAPPIGDLLAARLRTLGEQSGTRVLYGHDPEQFALLGPATRALV